MTAGPYAPTLTLFSYTGRNETSIQPTFVAALSSCFVQASAPLFICNWNNNTRNVQAVFCGEDHTLAIVRLEVGNLFSWGSNRKCQCGHPASRKKLDVPTAVPHFLQKKVPF
jgi:alpha-tubulin suppressor-like RCC1 family protein